MSDHMYDMLQTPPLITTMIQELYYSLVWPDHFLIGAHIKRSGQQR